MSCCICSLLVLFVICVSALPHEPAGTSAPLRLAKRHEAVRACHGILFRRRSAAPPTACLTHARCSLFARRCFVNSQNPPSSREIYTDNRQQAKRRGAMNSVAKQQLERCANEELESLDLLGQNLGADGARALATMLPKWYAHDRLPSSAFAISPLIIVIF